LLVLLPPLLRPLLFPYTTLFRSRLAPFFGPLRANTLNLGSCCEGALRSLPIPVPSNPPRRRRLTPVTRSALNHPRPTSRAAANRSEEHTSELQSRGHLVCRLLLE